MCHAILGGPLGRLLENAGEVMEVLDEDGNGLLVEGGHGGSFNSRSSS